MVLDVYRFKILDYTRALLMQKELQKKRKNEDINDSLILLQHPAVLTIGRNGTFGDILISRENLEKKGISVHNISRGGDVTYHGPGQLTAYIIINLYKEQKSLRKLVEKLEQVIIDLLEVEFNIHTQRHPDYRGVWHGDSKISALGISVDQGITMHGIALNVQPEMTHFDWIIPCGIQGKEVTSIEKISGKKTDMKKIYSIFLKHFCRIFRYDKTEYPEYDIINIQDS